MRPIEPLAYLPTHEVVNAPPHLGDQDLWTDDVPLRQWISVHRADRHRDSLATAGTRFGAEGVFEWAEQANRFVPELKAFDRYGMRVNQVTYHPAYHDLMALAIGSEVHSFGWRHDVAAHTANAALIYMFNQVEGGVMCPMAMSYSAIPSLRASPTLADEWIPRILSSTYDRRDIPVTQKNGATVGMFMTEKQGGSDVRANTTRAEPVGTATGNSAEYLLTGHKYFCSAPMCDAFLTLAYTAHGLSCFLLPRFKPDGTRNGLFIQRLKDKLGNRSNASSEMEFHNTYAVMVGEEGRGIRTIIDMVQGNRIYCAMSSAALMRQGLVQALHNTAHRQAFGRLLKDQPLMRNVLTDLALEVEAALALGLRIARAIDEAPDDPQAAAFARIGTAIAKYWICKRAPGHVFESLECHGGPGYIEDSIMPRLYREAPVNSIWEGSGNIMCLDMLRAISRDHTTLDAWFAQLDAVQGSDARLDRLITDLRIALYNADDLEVRARSLTQNMALAMQAALLIEHGHAEVADAFALHD